MYKGIKNVTINNSVWTQWNHYKIDVRKPLQSGIKIESSQVEISAGEITDSKGIFNGKQLLPCGPAVFTDTFNLDSSQLMDTFISE